MSRPAPMSQKKRKLEDGMRGKVPRPRKRAKKQRQYHSSSEDDDGSDAGFAPVDVQNSDDEAGSKAAVEKTVKRAQKLRQPIKEVKESDNESGASDDDENESADDDGSDGSQSPSAQDPRKRKVSKRNDPEAFSTSISKILSTKLPQSARKDPLLSRSKEAAETSSSVANERLEQRARAKIRAEKKEDLERGRVKDVVGVSTGETGKVAEEEKRLRKIAQRGVVKLFNAVRAAQVRGEQAAREERKKGTIGMAHREEKINEMSKQGFLELIGGKTKQTTAVEES